MGHHRRAVRGRFRPQFQCRRRRRREVDDLTNWVGVALDADGNTDLLFDKLGDGNGQHFQTAAVLEGVNLFAAYGVSSTGPGASQQVVDDLYAFNGHSALLLNQTH